MIRLNLNLFRTFAFILLAGSVLSACGGGGGDDDDRQTLDTTPPRVLTASPADGAVDVATDAVIRITFSESLLASSVSSTSITLSDGGVLVASAVSLAGNTVTVTPNQPLSETVVYTANVAATVSDLAGNRLAAPYGWSFTTGDFTPPTVTGTSPDDGADDVAIDELVVASLSEPLDPASVDVSSLTLSAAGDPVSGTVTIGMAGNTVVFTPDDVLSTLTDYDATLENTVADPAGNALDRTTAWQFRTSLAGTLSAVFASSEEPFVLRRTDAFEATVVGADVLSDPTWTGLEPGSIRLNPAGSLVAFRADELVADLMVGDELFVVSIEGGTPLRVSGALTNGGAVWTAAWAPDGSRLAYIADKETDDVNELYLVNADGSGTTKLTNGVNLDETFLSWSPDGSHIAVATNAGETPARALRIVPTAGGALVAISGPSSVEIDASVQPQWAPDSTLIAYADPNELFVNDVGGTNPVVVTPPAAVSVAGHQWLSDSDRLIWMGVETPGPAPQVLFVCGTTADSCSPITGINAYRFAAAPDDSLIAFTGDSGAAAQALYVVAPDGTGETVVSLTPAAAQDVRESTAPVWAPDSSAILYAERTSSTLKHELHLTGPDGASNTTLSDIEGTANELEAFSFSPDGSRVVYSAFATEGRIYSVSRDGVGRVELTDSAGSEDARAFSVRDDEGSVNGLLLAP